jgi:hypothetical protein
MTITPYYVSGEVGHWSDLAHRTLADLKATGQSAPRTRGDVPMPVQKLAQLLGCSPHPPG